MERIRTIIINIRKMGFNSEAEDNGNGIELVKYTKEDVLITFNNNIFKVIENDKKILMGSFKVSTHVDRLENYVKLLNRRMVMDKILNNES